MRLRSPSISANREFQLLEMRTDKRVMLSNDARHQENMSCHQFLSHSDSNRTHSTDCNSVTVSRQFSELPQIKISVQFPSYVYRASQRILKRQRRRSEAGCTIGQRDFSTTAGRAAYVGRDIGRDINLSDETTDVELQDILAALKNSNNPDKLSVLLGHLNEKVGHDQRDNYSESFCDEIQATTMKNARTNAAAEDHYQNEVCVNRAENSPIVKGIEELLPLSVATAKIFRESQLERFGDVLHLPTKCKASVSSSTDPVDWGAVERRQRRNLVLLRPMPSRDFSSALSAIDHSRWERKRFNQGKITKLVS